MEGNWTIVGALCGPDDGIHPALALVPADDYEIVDVWQTDGMRATGSNDIVITDVFVPEHRLVKVTDIYGGTAPGARPARRRRLPLADGAGARRSWPRCRRWARPSGWSRSITAAALRAGHRL